MLIFSIFLWFLVWSGYNTGIYRILSEGFPRGAFDFVHGARAIFPILAGLFALIFLFLKREKFSDFIKTPLGLLIVFTIIGLISSVFSTNFAEAFYWGLMYVSVLLVLYFLCKNDNALARIKNVININWAIASLLALFLISFLLVQPGVFDSLTFNAMICSGRPYEGLGGIGAEPDTFGMAGTRPTGLGRYAGIATLVFFVYLLSSEGKRKYAWLSLLVLFSAILLFSKGKATIIAFVASAVLAIALSRHFRIYAVSVLLIFCLFGSLVIFYNVPCSNEAGFISYVRNFIEEYKAKAKKSEVAVNNVIPEESVNVAEKKDAPDKDAPDKDVSDKEETPLGEEVKSSPGVSEDLETPEMPETPEIVEKPPQEEVKSSPKLPQISRKNIESMVTLSGRTSGVWWDAAILFSKSPTIGYGFHADRIFLRGQHIHNTLFHTLIQAGVLGTIPFLAAIVLTVLYLYRLLRSDLLPSREKTFLIVATVALAFIFIRGATESFAYYSADWLFLAPIIAYIQVLYFNRIRGAGFEPWSN